jgi:(1->4)-alpha-D-glucan 1-alpha-D-glucosylmutase
VDPSRVSGELGGEAGHRALADALKKHGLGQLLDIVPNHMSIASHENRLWWDVLRNGPSSPYAHFFDVAWGPLDGRVRRRRILLPVLEDHYGRVLERGLLRLAVEGGGVVLRYHDRVFPLAPRSLPTLLGMASQLAGSEEMEALSRAYASLPEPGVHDRRARSELGEQLRALDARLCRAMVPAAQREAVQDVLRRTEARADALDELLEQQRYRLAYWRAGVRELDYRRFFDVDTLVALRCEDEEVFLHTHERVLTWLRDGTLDGVRVDHVDGLRHPRRYLERLRAHAPGAWLLVEKILDPEERVSAGWPVQGSTGYDFIGDVGGLFIDPAGEAPLTDLYREVTGDTRSWRDVVVASKRGALSDLLAPDLERLTQLFLRACENRRRFRDYTRHELEDALREVAAHMAVYRTYVDDDAGAHPRDAEHVATALAGAARDRPDLDPELLDLLQRILLARREGRGARERELRLRFQQLTVAVTAKAVEDTAFYAWPRMIALNEVGGDPERFGVSVAQFHARVLERQARWPHGLLALSTHDTKRSEDVRARLAVLTEVPEQWDRAVRGWTLRNERLRSSTELDRSIEYLIYQTLVGAHPISLERALAYAEKTAREAKSRTSWINPNADYERALSAFVGGLFEDAEFQAELSLLVDLVRVTGWINGLAQKLVQLTAPGVPDLYQGSELWDLSLVDPDNRRPVDFGARRRLLAELEATRPNAEDIWQRAPEGVPKLWVVRQALALRAEHPEAFGVDGGYMALRAEGPAADHVVAFSRGELVATVVPRLTRRLDAAGGWRDTTVILPKGRWTNRLTGDPVRGGEIPVGGLLSRFPVALLARS